MTCPDMSLEAWRKLRDMRISDRIARVYSTQQFVWYQKIRIVEAQTDLGQIYYLMDEELNFIPYVKEYLDMIRARA